MKYIGKIGLTLLVTLIVSSCNDFLDVMIKGDICAISLAVDL